MEMPPVLLFQHPTEEVPILEGSGSWGKSLPPCLHWLSGHSSYEVGNCALTIDEAVAGVVGMTVELFRDDFHHQNRVIFKIGISYLINKELSSI